MKAAKSRKPKTPAELAYKQRDILQWDRLPFVGKVKTVSKYWMVPLVGDHLTSCMVGKNIALMYLKYCRDERDNPVRLAEELLRCMIRDLLALEATNEAEEEAKRGQYVGFTGEIARWLVASSEQLGRHLDQTSEQNLVDDANRLLNPSTAQVMQAALEVTYVQH